MSITVTFQSLHTVYNKNNLDARENLCLRNLSKAQVVKIYACEIYQKAQVVKIYARREENARIRFDIHRARTCRSGISSKMLNYMEI